jgi:hypothetical protein
MGGMLAHYTAPVQSAAGALQAGAQVSVYVNGSTENGIQAGTLTMIPLYPANALLNQLTNPFITSSGDIDFYMPFPQRVDLGVQVPGFASVYFPDVDVITSQVVPTVVTANYTLTLSDQLIMASAAAGSVQLQLPVSYAGLMYRFKRTDTIGGNSVTVVPEAGQLIDGGASLTVASLSHSAIIGDGTNWWTV